MERSQAHLRYLDGLRAVAVLAVVFYHAIAAADWAAPQLAARMQASPAWWFATLASKGTHGVDLFFVISGFCLAYPSLVRLRAGGSVDFDLRTFFSRRVVRILPPYYIAIALLALVSLYAGAFGFPKPAIATEGATAVSVLRQALFLDRGVVELTNAFWTLAVEFRWYLVFPALLALYVRAPRAFFTVLVACVVAYNLTRFRALDVATLPAFMLGIVAADWKIASYRFAKYAIPALLVSIDVALLLEPLSSAPSVFGGADEVGFYVQTNFGWQLASFFFVVVAGRAAALRRLLELPVLCAIGACAYGIYLVHMPIVGTWYVREGARLGPVVGVVGAIALAVVGGSLFSLAAERPFSSGSRRAFLVRCAHEPIARILKFCGMPASVRLVDTNVARASYDTVRAPDRTRADAPMLALPSER